MKVISYKNKNPKIKSLGDNIMSHIISIPKDRLTVFQQPCLGSGPINATIDSLKRDLSEGFDEIKWMLFCEELSRYVTVESLKGVPYNHLEDIHISRALKGFTDFNDNSNKQQTALDNFTNVFNLEVLRDFILYYLQHGHLAINYQQGVFICGMSYFDYMIDISNSFIDYFNSHFNEDEEDAKILADKCFREKVLYHTVTANGKFFDPSGQRTAPDVSRYVGQKVCDFKGQEVKLRILNSFIQEPQKTTVLSHGLAMYILNNILKIINYRYTNEYSRQQGRSSEITTNLLATIGQRVYYL